MFGTVLSAVFLVLLLYILARASQAPQFTRRLPRRVFLVLGLCLGGLFILGRTLGSLGPGIVPTAVEWLGMTLLGTVFLTAMTLFAVDLLTLFGYLFPTRAPSLRGGAIVAGLLLSGFALVQGAREPAIVPYQVTLAGLPARLDGTVLVAVSDAHLGGLHGEPWFTDRMAQVQSLKPNLIVFLGDMFEGHGNGPKEIKALQGLEAPLGKWYVVGNHESHGGAVEGAAALEQGGFKRLSNQWVNQTPGLLLAGVDDLTNARRRGGREGELVDQALANRPAGATILLSHSPLQAERAAQAGVGLMLSGHTNGGQIWPFGYLVQKAYPLFVGRYQVGDMTAIVSRGMGTWGPTMRLWKRGEIMRITLHAESR